MEESYLSELANIVNNDSRGQELAQFFREKSGKDVRRKVLGRVENCRMSIEVCTRKADDNEKPQSQQNESLPTSVAEPVPSENIQVPENRVNLNSESPAKISSRSPIGSYLKRTPHLTDKLRRSTLKRLAHQASGRSLLSAFNTVSESSAADEFSPRIASTPLYSNTPEKQNLLNNANENSNKEASKQCAAPSSPRRYTVEKGKSSGQILLTPLQSSNRDNGNNLNLTYGGKKHNDDLTITKHFQEQIPQTPTKLGNQNDLVVRVMQNSPRTSHIEINCTDHRVIVSPMPSTSNEHISSQKRTAQQENIVTPSHSSANNNTLLRRTNLEDQCNSLVTTSQVDNNNLSNSESESELEGGGTFTVPPTQPSPLIPTTENQSDIITDDEEQVPTETVRENMVENTVSIIKRNKNSTRTRKLRKRKSKSSEQIQISATPTEANISRSLRSRRYLTLNKAPRTPINGEKYADELKKQLAGLSNLEVLDLRRRKSSLNKSKLRISTKIPPLDARHDKNTHKKLVDKSVPPANSESDQSEEDIFEDAANNEEDNRNEHNEIDNEIIPPSPTQLRSDRLERELLGNDENNRNEDNNKITKTPPPIQSVNDGIEMEEFEDEENNDHVSFHPKEKNKESNTKKRKKHKKTPEVLKSYKNATQRISESNKKLNETKRSLYSANNNESNPGSPTSSSVGIVSPPFMFRSSTPRKRKSTSPPRSPLNSASSCTTTSNANIAETQNDNADDAIFKKPQGLPPKRKKKKTTKETISKEKNSTQQSTEDDSTVRRSTRDRKQVPVPLFYVMLQKNLIDSMEKSKQRKANAKRLSRNMTNLTSKISNASKTIHSRSETNFSKSQETNMLPEIPENEETTHDEIFTNLPTTSKSSKSQNRKRQTDKNSDQSKSNQTEISSSVSPSHQRENNDDRNEQRRAETPISTSNFLTWLKVVRNEQTTQQTSTNSQKTFMHMSLSTSNELTFTNHKDVDYAFYNTKEGKSMGYMGYMRFQPLQKKPPSRVKQNLNLLILSGEFNITSDGETGYSKEGDLVTINEGSRYSIENLSNDVSLILFLKH